LKIVGANCASFKIDLPINLMDKLGVIVCALFDLRDLTRAANKEAQPDSCERHLTRAANREAQIDSCELRHLARAANREAQLDSCWLGPLFEMAFDNQTSTKNHWGVL
jgi:hypothetical protein